MFKAWRGVEVSTVVADTGSEVDVVGGLVDTSVVEDN
jgi:hypothetical protein